MKSVNTYMYGYSYDALLEYLDLFKYYSRGLIVFSVGYSPIEECMLMCLVPAVNFYKNLNSKSAFLSPSQTPHYDPESLPTGN